MEQAVRPKRKKTKLKIKEQNAVDNSDVADPDVIDAECKDTIKEEKELNVPSQAVENVENEPVEEVTNAVDQINLDDVKAACSPVVPGHFYKLCSAKQDQDPTFPDNVRSEEVVEATMPVVDTETSLAVAEPSAPPDDSIAESPVSPSAPQLVENQDVVGELVFDDSLQDIINMHEETPIVEDEVEDVILPVIEDDWELGTGDPQVDHIYPFLDHTDDPHSSSVNMEPFTQEQLGIFYHNVLLEHADTYIDQFLMDSNTHHDQFKTLLSAYYQARQRLIKMKQNYANQQQIVQDAVENVFVTSEGKVEAEAFCQDHRKVFHTHRFEVCKYDSEASARLGSILREDRRIAADDVSLACYSSTVARLHCEQCLHDVTERHRRHRNRFKESAKTMTTTTQSSILLQLIDESVTELKCICNVLFSFVRRRRTQDEADDRFWSDVEKWIALVILNLLQSSDSSSSAGRHFSEEMFVMNHILRCPPGVHQWGSGLVQVSGPNQTNGNKKDQTSLDHSICLLYLALRPPKGRDGFLAEFKRCRSSNGSDDQPPGEWALIDDDGDEVDSQSSSQLLLPLENDLIAIFRQIPLEALLAHILHLTKPSGGAYCYANPSISSEDMMLTLAACDLICDILGEGLATFGRPKYKQLVRRVAQAIRNIVLVVSQQWQHYILLDETTSTPQTYNIHRLQLEYDEFCKRCVSRLLSVAKLGIYQFIADLSYQNVSPRAAETLYLLMNVPPGVRSEVDTLISAGYSKQEWLDFIQDPDTKLAFEEQLSTMPANEIVYLLTTFANLAQARPTTERHLVNIIAVDIFKVSFVYKSTRDVCSKTGRELLCSVTCQHSYVISTLLRFVEENLTTVSSVAIYALSDLPFSSWKPTSDDVSLLRTWLFANQINSTECKLAQIIIQGLNLDYNPKHGTLYITPSIHQQLALILVETCVRIQQQQAGFVMKSFDQVNKVTSAVKLTSHPLHQQFLSWSWKILLKLKLHRNMQMSPNHHSCPVTEIDKVKVPLVIERLLPVNYSIHLVPLNGELSLKCVAQAHTSRVEPASLDVASIAKHFKVTTNGYVKQPLETSDETAEEENYVIPDINTVSMFLPILHSAKEKHPMACYVAITMSLIGHRMDAFLHDGLEYLHHLVSSGNAVAVLSCLDSCIPMFYGSQINLAQNHRFTDTLIRLLHLSDEGFVAGLTSFLLPDASNQESCVHLLSSVVANHIEKASNDTEAMAALSYWLQMILATSGWYKDRHLRALIDDIFKSSFLLGEACMLECRTMVYDNYVSMILHSPHGSQSSHHKGVMSSFFHMVAGGGQHEPASFIPTIASSENIYFKYEVLLTESRYEDDTKLWTTVLATLQSDPKMSVDSAMKRASSKLKLNHAPTHSHLSLYRWGELALHTSHEHPLLPVVWYNFFLRFVYLPPDGGNSSGCRFFDAVSMLPMYNKLRLRLQSSMEHHYGVISSKSADPNVLNNHQILVKLFQAFKLWIEEPKIHDCNLYLPSLPDQYNPGMLACVRVRNVSACDDSINKSRIRKEVETLAETWSKLKNPEKLKRRNYVRQSYHRHKSTDESQERITHLLKQFETPQPIPDHIMYGTWAPPVSVNDVASLCDYDAVLREVDQDLKAISSFASQFTQRCNKQQQINRDYLTVLPHLYFLKATEVSVKVECQSAFSPTHKCSGAADIQLRFKQKTLNESASEKLDANRSSYTSELDDLMSDKLSEELSYTSIHIESVIRALEANSKKATHGDDLKRIVFDAGIKLFYLFSDMYSGERSACQPTKQLLAAAVELLGQSFISQSHDQALHILDQVLNNPSSASLLSPHFAPGFNSRMSPDAGIKEYIKMYQRVVKIVSTTKKDDPDVLFVLLTKFEMPSWLNDVLPSLSDRVELLQYVVIGLVGCVSRMPGANTSNDERVDGTPREVMLHKPSHSAVHAVYLNHYRALLSHHFPDMFINYLHYLLEASRTHDVTVEPWDVLLSVAFTDQLPGQPDNQLEPDGSYYSSRIDWNTLQTAVELVTGYFSNFRESSTETISNGLYPTWYPYVPSIASLLSCLCNTMLVFVRRQQVPLLYTETMLTNDPQWTILEPVFNLFAGFIRPVPNLDTRELCWPWMERDGVLVKFITDSFAGVLKQFCQNGSHEVTPYLSYVWSIYAKTFLQEKHKVPSYIYDSYHTMLKGLPWQSFLPDVTSMDQMLQLSDGQDDNPIQFLCFVVPKIPWPTIIDMCHLNAQASLSNDLSTPSTGYDQWNPVTAEVLCRLLHLLFSLGSKAQRLESHSDLKQLFADVETFPWHCISADQVDYLANLLSDRFSWTSVLLYQSVKAHKADPRYCAVRLLKIVCGLPLVGEEKGSIKSSVSVHSLSSLPSQCIPSDWLKRQSYIRATGRLLQKVKGDDKAVVSIATKPLLRFIERTFESVEMTSSYGEASLNLSSLISVFFDYINKFPSALQEIVLNAIRSVISRRAMCSRCSAMQEESTWLQQCQDCTYMRSRALSPDTLLSCLTATCTTIAYAGYACVLVEDVVESYIDGATVPNEEQKPMNRLEVSSATWSSVTSAFHKPATNNEEFIKHCLTNGCLLSLYVYTLHSMPLPGFHDKFQYLTGDLPSDEIVGKLYKLAVLDIQRLSSISASQENESKHFLLWDHFLSICAVLMKNATFSPKQGFTVYTVADTISSLLPLLEHVSIDRVKTGLLGSIGISKQSPLSPEFRLSARSLSVFIKHWVARINPESPDAIESAQKAFEALKDLATTNKIYQPFRPTIEEACNMLCEESPDLTQERKFLSLFIKYFVGKKFLYHMTEL